MANNDNKKLEGSESVGLKARAMQIGKIYGYEGMYDLEEYPVYDYDKGKDDIEIVIRKLVRKRLNDRAYVDINAITSDFHLYDDEDGTDDKCSRTMFNDEVITIDPHYESYYDAIDEEIRDFKINNGLKADEHSLLNIIRYMLAHPCDGEEKIEVSGDFLKPLIKRYVKDDVVVFYEKTNTAGKGIDQLIDDLLYLKEVLGEKAIAKKCEIIGKFDRPNPNGLQDYKGNNIGNDIIMDINHYKDMPLLIAYGFDKDDKYYGFLLGYDSKVNVFFILRPEFHNFTLLSN